jgi:uncharacterized membrane protein YhdT
MKDGKSARRRFYIGFSLMYLVVWVALFYYVLIKGLTPVPFFTMFMVVYVVMVLYMIYVDVYSLSIVRRSKRMLEEDNTTFGEKYSLSVNINTLILKWRNNVEEYNVNDVLGFKENSMFITVFFNENKGISFPLTDISFIEGIIERL